MRHFLRGLAGAFCLAVGLSAAVVAPASAFTLANDNGGDGYVNLSSTGFSLYGSDNQSGANYTTYTQMSGADQTITFNYTYKTFDCCGSYWDPAGYVLGGSYVQLTPSVSPGTDIGATYTGSGSFNVTAGEEYGFYVYTQDGYQGRGEITVGLGVSGVPLPASAPMFGAALLALAGFGYGMNRWVAPKGKKAAAA